MHADGEVSAQRVAIVDDHPLVVDSLARHIGANPGTEVVYTGDDPRHLLDNWPDPSIVLLDLDLGKRTVTPRLVLELLTRGTRVLVISAATDLSLVRQLLNVGISGVVSKAEPLNVLSEALEAVARGEDWTSPQVIAAIAGSPELDFPSLSTQEQRVIILYASGLKIPAVAHKLGLSPHTVKDYLRRARAKFSAVGRHAPSQVHLYQEAVRLGLIDDGQ